MNRVMKPILVFPPILKLRMKGRGSARIRVSRHMLLEACAIQVAKNSSAFLLPHPTQCPSRVKSQFLAIGVHDSSDKKPNVSPHRPTKIRMPQVALRAKVERPSKRRRYCVRIEILINVVLKQ